MVSPLEQLTGKRRFVNGHWGATEPGAEIVFEVGHSLIAVCGIFLQGFDADGIKFRGDLLFRSSAAGGADGIFLKSSTDFPEVAAADVAFAGEHFKQDDAHVEDVGAFIDVAGFHGLFGGHVKRCALNIAAVGEPTGDVLLAAAEQLIDFVIVLHGGDFGESPVHDHDFAVVSDHDIGWFHIAVHDALVVSEREALSAVQQGIDDCLTRIAADEFGITFGDAIKNFAEISTAEPLHGEVGVAFGVAAEFVDGDGAGVRNLGGDAGFAEESFLVGFEVLVLRQKGFHHDGAAEIFIQTGSQQCFATLSERLEVSVAHEAVAHVLWKVTVGIGHVNVISHSSTFEGKSLSGLEAIANSDKNRKRTTGTVAKSPEIPQWKWAFRLHLLSCPALSFYSTASLLTDFLALCC